ncbi:uncharacterized protein TRIVIDRAFT_19490, partial [Trichoderma virens Gv29-8]
VPWPGNTYTIQVKGSGEVIATWVGQVYVRGPAGIMKETTHWLCVEANGYFGFFNKYTNKYLSFQDDLVPTDRMQATSTFGSSQLFLPRRHPEGGYQLLVPASNNTLKQVATLNDGETLITRLHAGVIWEFI